jgi:hypothetical protein
MPEYAAASFMHVVHAVHGESPAEEFFTNPAAAFSAAEVRSDAIATLFIKDDPVRHRPMLTGATHTVRQPVSGWTIHRPRSRHANCWNRDTGVERNADEKASLTTT